YRTAAPRQLRAFPTRRSSDLRQRPCDRVLANAPIERAVAGGPDRQQPSTGGLPHLEADTGAHQVTRRSVVPGRPEAPGGLGETEDRKSTRLNSSHVKISYAVF